MNYTRRNISLQFPYSCLLDNSGIDSWREQTTTLHKWFSNNVRMWRTYCTALWGHGTESDSNRNIPKSRKMWVTHTDSRLSHEHITNDETHRLWQIRTYLERVFSLGLEWVLGSRVFICWWKMVFGETWADWLSSSGRLDWKQRVQHVWVSPGGGLHRSQDPTTRGCLEWWFDVGRSVRPLLRDLHSRSAVLSLWTIKHFHHSQF